MSTSSGFPPFRSPVLRRAALVAAMVDRGEIKVQPIDVKSEVEEFCAAFERCLLGMTEDKKAEIRFKVAALGIALTIEKALAPSSAGASTRRGASVRRKWNLPDGNHGDNNLPALQQRNAGAR